MAVPKCTICDSSEEFKQQQTAEDLDQGDYCPVCFNPTCLKHLATVRFRWRDSGQLDTALVCRNCKNTYQHRYWDSARRDWIS